MGNGKRDARRLRMEADVLFDQRASEVGSLKLQNAGLVRELSESRMLLHAAEKKAALWVARFVWGVSAALVLATGLAVYCGHLVGWW